VDVVGSASPLADAEVECALAEALDAVGVREYQVPDELAAGVIGPAGGLRRSTDLGGGVLITLDKLGKMSPEKVAAELVDSGHWRLTTPMHWWVI
jgi:histidyl-tRNA synthetase